MTTRNAASAAISAACLSLLLTAGCTGGSETTAAEEQAPGRTDTATTQQQQTNARAELSQISEAIPVYAGAEYRDDLTRRDAVMVRNQYGQGAEVITMATDDSFPQVFHYYTTYLAQFRGFPAQDTYPNERKNWRTLEVQLNQAMQDPFIPGRTLNAGGKQVILQVNETEAEPKTVIRYIVTPGPTPQQIPVATASSAEPSPGAVPVAR